MKRKRFCRICAVCVLALTVLLTAGCSSKKSEEKKTTAEETAVPAAALTEEMEEDQVLLDESGLKITANRMFYDEAYGKGVQLTFENHSGKILIFDCKSIFVNGFAEVEDTFAELLNKDETKQVNVYLDTMELEAYGIDEIGEVGFRFDFYTPQTYEKYLTPDVIGFQTSAYADMPEEMKFAGKVLYEDENVTLGAIYTAKSDIYQNALTLYVENHTDREMMLVCRNVSVNGKDIGQHMVTQVQGQKVMLSHQVLSEDTLAAAEIETVEDIRLSFEIYSGPEATPLGETNDMQAEIQ